MIKGNLIEIMSMFLKFTKINLEPYIQSEWNQWKSLVYLYNELSTRNC